MNNIFHSYEPHKGPIEKTRKGVMISLNKGKSTGFALEPLEQRGYLFIGPQVMCYEGMIVGICAKEADINVNPCKEKHLTNMRSTGSEDQVRLSPIKTFTIEEAITFIQQDELLEITPNYLRMRKKVLSEQQRKMDERKMKK
jgi:GTP-binding protein